MNANSIKDYLYKLAKVDDMESDFHNFAISFIDFCEGKNFINYMESSRFETSIPVKNFSFKARFIHYLKFKKDLPLKIRKLAGYLAAYRIVKMLKKAGFSYHIAFKILSGCGELWNIFPNTIVSAEWDMKKEKFDKFTLYIVCGNSFNMKSCNFFARLFNLESDLIYKISRNIDFLGIDFFPDNKIILKIYNRFPFNEKFKPEKWEKIFLEKFKFIKIKTVIRVNRIFSESKFIENDRSHFIVDGIEVLKLKKIIPGYYKKIFSLMENKAVNVFSIDKKAKICELYID